MRFGVQPLAAADGLLAEVADVDLADIPQMEPVRKRLLEKAMEGYREFLTQKGEDSLVRWGTGRSLVRLSDIQAMLGEYPTADASYREAIAKLKALVDSEPANVDFRRDLARAYHGLGVLLKTNTPTLACGRTKSGIPSSAKLGTLGRYCERVDEATAIPLSLPLLMCGTTLLTTSNVS